MELINAEYLGLARWGYIAKAEIKRVKVNALVDTRAYMLCINQHLQTQLGLTVKDRQEVELADGSLANYDIAGPIEIRFKNRLNCCNALVFPGEKAEVLLGSIPMEDMDVLIEPRPRTNSKPSQPIYGQEKSKIKGRHHELHF